MGELACPLNILHHYKGDGAQLRFGRRDAYDTVVTVDNKERAAKTQKLIYRRDVCARRQYTKKNENEPNKPTDAMQQGRRRRPGSSN